MGWGVKNISYPPLSFGHTATSDPFPKGPVPELRPGVGLHSKPPSFSLARVAWRWAMFTFKQKPYPKLSTASPKPPSWALQLPPTTGCSPEKIQAWTGFEPTTSVILVQRSTNWANKPTGSCSLCWFLINSFVNNLIEEEKKCFHITLCKIDGAPFFSWQFSFFNCFFFWAKPKLRHRYFSIVYRIIPFYFNVEI